jgi:hypothetical protein
MWAKELSVQLGIDHHTLDFGRPASERAQCPRFRIDKKYTSKGGNACGFETPKFIPEAYIEIEFLDEVDGCKLANLRLKPRRYHEWRYTGPRT